MKILAFALILLSIHVSFSAPVIDSRYDNLEGPALILQLIADQQWGNAQFIFDTEKREIERQAPAEFHLIQSLLLKNKSQLTASTLEVIKSLEIQYSDLAMETLLDHALQKNDWKLGLEWLENCKKNIYSKKISSEIVFLKKTANESAFLAPSLLWMEDHLKNSYDFQLLKLYVEILVQKKIYNEARQAIEWALDTKKIKSAEESLTLAEIFLATGLDSDIQFFLEKSRLQFPANDLIKLNLAQVMFKKDLTTSALNLLAELKMDDDVLSVQIELMNLMQVKSYSLFHRLQIQDHSLHLKNWFVYLINNEDWSLLYSLYPRYKTSEKWSSDEFNYAMAYSSRSVNDLVQTIHFTDHVTNPNLAQKKTKLLDSFSSKQH
ncbi:MAG: hypothetical protein JNL11_10400 [Bdellovibrionaceae bacterium]|nr:hypothetical protein [Pseudobdellovibrionaceae bacterium]